MLADRATLECLEQQVTKAICPEQVFGNLAGAAPEQLATLRYKGRQLTRQCHPDLAEVGDKVLATQVFQWLGRWEERAKQKIDAGTYGDYQPYRTPAPAYTPTTLDVRGKPLVLTSLIGEGTFADVHAGEYDSDVRNPVFVKCAREVDDNDLLEREYRTLKVFQQSDPVPEVEEFLRKQRVYVPTPLASFFLLDENGAKHRANVLRVPNDRCFTIQTLREEKFPDGIEPRHVWWIFRRLLLTNWMSHLKGFIHGAITPDHVLVYPEAHGLVLLDWTCAARIGEEHVPALNPAFEEFYPPEVWNKELASPTTDIFMAAAVAIYMLGGDLTTGYVPSIVSPPLCDLLLRCVDPDPRRRPQDAERLHNECGARLGRRVYSHMIVP